MAQHKPHISRKDRNLPEPRKASGNGAMPTRRDKNGLTEKMRLSLPIIATAKTRHQGVLACVEQGIVGSANYFYRAWMKDENYVAELNREREVVQGASRDRVLQLLLSYDEAVATELIAVALSQRSDKMRAVESLLTILGFDTGRGTRLNVTNNIANIADRQKSFTEQIERVLQDRTDRKQSAE